MEFTISTYLNIEVKEPSLSSIPASLFLSLHGLPLTVHEQIESLEWVFEFISLHTHRLFSKVLSLQNRKQSEPALLSFEHSHPFNSNEVSHRTLFSISFIGLDAVDPGVDDVSISLVVMVLVEVVDVAVVVVCVICVVDVSCGTGVVPVLVSVKSSSSQA